MDIDNNTSNMNTNTQPPMHIAPKQSKGKKVLVGILVAILVLAAGAVGGYFLGQYQKNQEVEQAKKDAQNAAQQEIDNAKSAADHHATPEKTVTETTCNTDELSLALDATDAAAGTYAYTLTFANTGSRTCTLYGYPGVSLVNDNGNMIGSPAERTENTEEQTMTLAPQGEVKAMLYAANSDNFSNGQCTEGATKLRVYPPNDPGYLSIATENTQLNVWCPGFEVSPVTGV